MTVFALPTSQYEAQLECGVNVLCQLRVPMYMQSLGSQLLVGHKQTIVLESYYF